jgi:lipoprotein-anchoring transpeptidase ErfK/SrfK
MAFRRSTALLAGVPFVALALAAVALVAVGVGSGGHHASATVRSNAHRAAATAAAPASAPAGTTLVATTHGAIPGSPAPGAAANRLVPASWYGYPSVLPVIDSAPNWVEVRLAQRPNGTTTWVPQADVMLSDTSYRIVVDLGTEHLDVYRYGKEIMDFPAGIGTPDDPTVTGQYFVTMRVPPPDPGYGPFVLVTSAHSDAISDWEDSGDAIIAIHGPITSYDDTLIGTTGAAISHGCIRLHDADLAQLAVIPAGTPVDIVTGAT